MFPQAQAPDPHGLLRGRRAVITAAAGTGIGFATAQRLAAEGASLVISDRHERRLGEAAEKLAQEGAPVVPIPCDVTEQEQVEALLQRSQEALGGLDVLVNNAGLGHSGDVVETSDADWQRVFDVTLTGTFRCLRAALPRMARGGTIINVGSVTAHRAERGQAAYGAAKAGVHALTRCAAIEAAPRGVRVNAVAPTLALHPFLTRVADPAHLDAMARLQCQGRPAEPWEIGSTIVFLASDLSSYLTGECLSVSSQRS